MGSVYRSPFFCAEQGLDCGIYGNRGGEPFLMTIYKNKLRQMSNI